MHRSLSHLSMTVAQLLVVGEDQGSNQKLDHFLSGAGYGVTTANRAEALAKCAEQAIDLVLLNMMRQEIEGVALCQELRRRSDVPIILLAALHQVDVMIQGLDAGADDAIAHPFAPEELLAHIGALLRRLQWIAAGTRNPDQPRLKNGTVVHQADQMYVAGTAALWERPAPAFTADD